MWNVFIYTKSKILRKKQDNFRYLFIYKNHDTLRYAFFCENFEVGIYIQKSWHFALPDIFIYKKRDTSQKSRQFALRFYIQNLDTLRYAISHWTFEIGGGGGNFLYLKNALYVIFLYVKTIHFALHFYIQKVWHFALHFYMQKILHFALLFISKFMI